MTQITPSGNTAGNASGVTITLSAEQLKALGLKHLPAEGAEVKLRATVSRPGTTGDAGDADDDSDADAGFAAPGADDDADAAGGSGAPTPALTLRLTGLELTQARKAPDKVLYGGTQPGG